MRRPDPDDPLRNLADLARSIGFGQEYGSTEFADDADYMAAEAALRASLARIRAVVEVAAQIDEFTIRYQLSPRQPERNEWATALELAHDALRRHLGSLTDEDRRLLGMERE